MTRERRSRRTEKEWPIIITYHWKRTRRVRRGGGKGGGMTAHVQGSELHRTRLGAAGVVRPQIVNNDTFLIWNRRSLGPKLIEHLSIVNTKFHCWLDVSTTPLNRGSLWLPVLGKSFSCFRSKKTLYLTKMWVEPWIMGVDGMISEKSALSHFHAQECRCHWSIYKLWWNLNTLTSCM